MGFFSNFKTQNLSIDLNIELYVSVIALYDEDTVSPVRVEIWKENIFFIFLSFCRTLFYFLFSFFATFLTPPLTHFQTKKLITITLFMIFNKNGVE